MLKLLVGSAALSVMAAIGYGIARAIVNYPEPFAIAVALLLAYGIGSAIMEDW
jgi:hypothetical protein